MRRLRSKQALLGAPSAGCLAELVCSQAVSWKFAAQTIRIVAYVSIFYGVSIRGDFCLLGFMGWHLEMIEFLADLG